MELREDQRTQVDRAKAVLHETGTGYDAMALAGRVGRLEWHLQEMLHLISDLAAASSSAGLGRLARADRAQESPPCGHRA